MPNITELREDTAEQYRHERPKLFDFKNMVIK